MRFEALRETLLRGGIAPRHVRRYLRELTDHLCDLTEAQLAAGHDQADAAARALALLGGEEELAAAMLAQPGLKSLPARAPWLFFGPLPLLAILAGFFAAGLPLVLIASLHGWMGHAHSASPGWFRALAQAMTVIADLVLGPALAALLVWMANRQRLNWKYPLLGIAILALSGAHMVAQFPPAGQHGGQIGIGLLLEATHGFVGPAQFLLTLTPALWLLGRGRFARLTGPR